MNLSDIDTETLKKNLQEANNWLTWSRNLVSKKGGWMAWDGDKEDRIQRIADKIRAELSNRIKVKQ